MITVVEWLAERHPPPPPELASSLDVDPEGTDHVACLMVAAQKQLDLARSRPGRERESAFPLLVADALLTYACEAALQRSDADRLIMELLQVGEPR